MLDRDASRRTQEDLCEQLAQDPATRIVLVDARGRVALDAPAIHPDLPTDGLTPPGSREPAAGTQRATLEPAARGLRLAPLRAGDLDLAGLQTFYLGRLVPAADSATGDASGAGSDATGAGTESGTGPGTATVAAEISADPSSPCPAPDGGEGAGGAWVGVVIPNEAVTPPTDAEGAGRARPDLAAILDRYPRSALRAVAAGMPGWEVELATAAVALAAWHARSRFCTRCGARTAPIQAGWAQRCTGCADVSFPRTDPAVIMAVTDAADRLVLVHGAAWEPGRYSTVAGFVEAGESAEAAVAREVAEETGLRVDSVEPVRTQPWPFPRSLMLAYRARLADVAITPRADGEEVTDVLLLTRSELAQAVARGRVVLPGPASVAAWLIEDWFGGPVTSV